MYEAIAVVRDVAIILAVIILSSVAIIVGVAVVKLMEKVEKVEAFAVDVAQGVANPIKGVIRLVLGKKAGG